MPDIGEGVWALTMMRPHQVRSNYLAAQLYAILDGPDQVHGPYIRIQHSDYGYDGPSSSTVSRHLISLGSRLDQPL